MYELSYKSKYLENLETIDEESQQIVDDYWGIICSVNVTDYSHFSFSVPALTKDKDFIHGLKVRVWYYDDTDTYEHSWFDGEKNSDDTWTISNDLLIYKAGKFVLNQLLIFVIVLFIYFVFDLIIRHTPLKFMTGK